MNKKILISGIIGALFLAGIIILLITMPEKKNNKNKDNIEVARVIESTEESTVVESTVIESVVDSEPIEIVEGNDVPEEVAPSPEVNDNDDNNVKKEDIKEEEKVEPVVKETGTPVANHGKLSVKGTQLVDKNGKAFQIKGVSTHGIAWFPEYVNKAGFQTIRDEWGANCIRLAMYSDEYNGYCSGGDKNQLKKIVDNGVQYTKELGMYVIIDWHVLGEKDPNVHKSDAIAFFDEMSKKYANYENVIYEICNEPNGGTSWSQVKSYAEEVIPVIKANNPDAIIIVGTPTWSQDVDQAAANPIKGYSNIMYTIHFYAETHRDDLRRKMNNAVDSGLPIFCTEFGICDASGNGAINKAEADKWISAMNAKGVSYCIWNLSNKAESSSLISSGCSKKSGWTESDLSEEGKWYVGILNGRAVGTTPDDSNSDNNNNNNDNNNNDSSPAASANSGNTSVSISQSGGWDEGSDKCYQYTIKITNTSSSKIKDWKVTVDFGTNVTLNNSWSGTFSVNGSKVTITPAEYNREIDAGSSYNDVGFIIKASGSVNPQISVN